MIYVLKNLNKYIHAFFSFLFGNLYPTNCFKTEIFYVQKRKIRLCQLNQALKTCKQ